MALKHKSKKLHVWRTFSNEAFVMEVTTIDKRDCWQINPLAELVVHATSVCCTLYYYNVTHHHYISFCTGKQNCQYALYTWYICKIPEKVHVQLMLPFIKIPIFHSSFQKCTCLLYCAPLRVLTLECSFKTFLSICKFTVCTHSNENLKT
jgi:hypothetical protein